MIQLPLLDIPKQPQNSKKGITCVTSKQIRAFVKDSLNEFSGRQAAREHRRFLKRQPKGQKGAGMPSLFDVKESL